MCRGHKFIAVIPNLLRFLLLSMSLESTAHWSEAHWGTLSYPARSLVNPEPTLNLKFNREGTRSDQTRPLAPASPYEEPLDRRNTFKCAPSVCSSGGHFKAVIHSKTHLRPFTTRVTNLLILHTWSLFCLQTKLPPADYSFFTQRPQTLLLPSFAS